MTESSLRREIFVVDDDAKMRNLLSALLSRAGYTVIAFAEGSSFLAETRKRVPACIILDVNMPGKSGIDLLKELNAQNYPTPIFIMSGQGDIPLAVDAIKNGGFDFIEKPFRAEALLKRIVEAIDLNQRRQNADAQKSKPPFPFPGGETLTRREHEVLAQIKNGASNKIAAYELGISQRTIEVHRANIMEKLGAKTVADLFRIVMGSGHVSD